MLVLSYKDEKGVITFWFYIFMSDMDVTFSKMRDAYFCNLKFYNMYALLHLQFSKSSGRNTVSVFFENNFIFLHLKFLTETAKYYACVSFLR